MKKILIILLALGVIVSSVGWALTSDALQQAQEEAKAVTYEFETYKDTSVPLGDYLLLKEDWSDVVGELGVLKAEYYSQSMWYESAKRDLEKAELALEKAKEVQVIEIHRPTSGFSTREKLHQWLSQDPTNNHPYVENVYMCENFARDLVRAAEEDGYWIGLLEVFIEYKDDTLWYHAKNYVVIEARIYEVEPQTDEICLLRPND